MMLLLLGKSGQSCLKDFVEEVVWRAFTEFDMPGKVIRAEWDSSPLMKIYDETDGQNNLRTIHTKFFLLQELRPGTKVRSKPEVRHRTSVVTERKEKKRKEKNYESHSTKV